VCQAVQARLKPTPLTRRTIGAVRFGEVFVNKVLGGFAAGFVAAATFVGVAPLAPAQTNILASVSAHLKAVDTMTASFTQTDARGAVVSGKLSMKRPGRIRFEYQKGVPILLVSDGKALIFVDYQVKQVQRWPITNTPLGVLLDPSRDLSRYAKVLPNADPKIVLVETRDPKHPEYGVITLAFYRNDSAPGGLMLQGWVALDGQNKRTVIRLGGQQFNVAISDQAFTWRDPRIKTRGR
jgi:chaperone LolA